MQWKHAEQAAAEKQWAHLFLQFDYFSLSVVQGLVADLDVPALVLVVGAQRVKLDLKFLLLPLGLFVCGAAKQWKEIGSIQVSVFCKQTVRLIAFRSLVTATSHNPENISRKSTHSEPEAERWFCGCPQCPHTLWLLAVCWLFPYVLGLEEGQMQWRKTKHVAQKLYKVILDLTFLAIKNQNIWLSYKGPVSVERTAKNIAWNSKKKKKNGNKIIAFHLLTFFF